MFANICYRCDNICNVRTMIICYNGYVNCVLGYERLCYLNMLHVLSCTFLHENNIYTKTNNTGCPALDPTANKYLSGSGWDISVCPVVVYVVLRGVLYVFCCYMCFSIVNAKA